MMATNEIHVKIGEVKTGKRGDILKTTLGSCVGIAFLWKSENKFALAHCLLPESTDSINTIGAKFVNQAIPSLIALLKIKSENVREIEVHLAGGGNMMSQLSRKNVDHVGTMNILAAQKLLEAQGFKIRSMDVGGEEGRQMYVDCSTGKVSVIKIQKGLMG